MKKVIGTLVFLFVLGLAANGFAADRVFFKGVDKNGDNVATLEEIQAMYPDVTEDMRMSFDVNGDGNVSAWEWHRADIWTQQ
jgi:hypothetical protein